MRGANRTGRPFTGDFAGVLLYRTLIRFGLASGPYGAIPTDGMTLQDCRVTNAVRCVPPGNLPTPAEIGDLQSVPYREIAAMPTLRALLALGGTAHAAVLRAHGLPGAKRLPPWRTTYLPGARCWPTAIMCPGSTRTPAG